MLTQPPPPHLPDPQLNFLLYGPRDAYDDAFDTEAEARAAWEKNRASILAWYQSGRRPWAWRTYDRPDLPWRGYAHEQSGSWRAGDVLSVEEKTLLERRWRQEFEKAQQPNFFHCAGQDRFLTGEQAKRAHFREVDIPHELIKRWTTAERRHTKKEPRAISLQSPESKSA